MKRLSIALLVLLPVLAVAAWFLGWLGPGAGESPGARPRSEVGEGGVRFVDVAAQSGIEFLHVDGRSGRKYPPEMFGSGAAFFDYDGDGDADLYLVNGAPLPGYEGTETPTNRLYRNDAGRFVDVTMEAGAGDTGYGHGCAAGDYDRDGDLDLYVTNYGSNVLYRNNGDGTFTDVTEEAGVTEPRWSTSCAFADYDLDGDLDLYVVNYLELDLEENPWCGLREEGVRGYCEPNNFEGQPDALYRNDGDGTFTDVTTPSGVHNPGGKGLGVVWGDYDGDGDPDIYVANDSTENFLYQNKGDGTFEDVAFVAGVALSKDGAPENGMGTAFGDWDGDGWLDLTVTNYAKQTNTLYRNDRDGFFSDVTTSSKTGPATYPLLGWATEFFDYDNDGYLDLFVANGHLHDNLAELGQEGTYGQRNLVFRNRRDGTFEEVSSELGPGLRLEDVSRGAAFADYDLDGDVDILVTNSGGAPRLLRNDDGNRGHWLAVKLIGTRSSTDGIGARVTLRLGELVQTREVRSGSGYLSQNELRLVFGLGGRATVDAVEVRWPRGSRSRLTGVAADQVLTITEGEDAGTDG